MPSLSLAHLHETHKYWESKSTNEWYSRLLAKVRWMGCEGDNPFALKGHVEFFEGTFAHWATFDPVGRQKAKKKPDPHVNIHAQLHEWDLSCLNEWGMAKPGEFPENPWRQQAKYSKGLIEPDLDVAMEAFSWMYHDEAKWISGYGGMNDQQALNNMDPNKSTGCLWNRLFGSTAQMLTAIKSHFCDLYSDLAKGQEYVFFWQGQEKEEVRDMAKLAERKVRVFTASSKEFTYCVDRLFGLQNAAWTNNWRQLGHTVGFSKWEGGWHQLITKVLELPNCFDLDVGGMDASLPLWVVHLLSTMDYLLLPAEQRTEESWRVFRQVLRSRLFSLVTDPEGQSWLIPGGNKSGDKDTIKINTRFLKWLFNYAWIKLVGPSQNLMKEHTRIWAQGDDAIFSVSDEYVTQFNFTTIKALLKQDWNIDLETATPMPRPADKCVFLGHTSRREGLWWVPVPSSEKVIASLLLGGKNQLPNTLERAAAIYREMYWNSDWRTKIRELIQDLRQKGVYLDTDEWRLALAQVLPDTDVELLYLGSIGERS
jgi:hypothetical protein